MNKHFLEILEKSKEIHSKKAADYTTDSNTDPHENFTRASEIASWFPKEYGSYSALIGTKLSRLAALLSSGRAPNNESLDDTFLDLLTYVGLMYSFYKDRQVQEKVEYAGPEETFVFHKGYQEFKENPIGEPEYIRGLGTDVTTTPFKDDKGINQCWHNYVNSQHICDNCGLVISFESIARRYLFEPTSDKYVRKV